MTLKNGQLPKKERKVEARESVCVFDGGGPKLKHGDQPPRPLPTLDFDWIDWVKARLSWEILAGIWKVWARGEGRVPKLTLAGPSPKWLQRQHKPICSFVASRRATSKLPDSVRNPWRGTLSDLKALSTAQGQLRMRREERVLHVEAGLRTFNSYQTRRLTFHAQHLLPLGPTARAASTFNRRKTKPEIARAVAKGPRGNATMTCGGKPRV